MTRGIRSESGKLRRVAIVGGGVAGLSATLRLAELGVPVDLYSLVPVRRSHSVVAQGGISGGDGSGTEEDARAFFEETIEAGEFLAHQPPVLGMALAAPQIVDLFDRMGVPFHRTAEGRVDRRRLSGGAVARAAFAGATTGQQILYALDEQVRRLEAEPALDERGLRVPGETLVKKLERWDFIEIVRDDAGTCVGLVAQDLVSMDIKAFAYDAVLLATGGPGAIFGKSAFGATTTSAAAAAVVRQGAVYANAEFIQMHPTAVSGANKQHVISDALRAEGARLWVPNSKTDRRPPREIPEKERDYFLERASSPLGNLSAADVATRAILSICLKEERGIFDAATETNSNAVYLDATHVGQRTLRARLGGAVDTWDKLLGVNVCTTPLKVFPAVSYSMGGLWVDYESGAGGAIAPVSPRNQATSIPGLYAAGEVEYQYHGANRLGGGSLLSCAYGGLLAAGAIAAYRSAMERSALDLPKSIFEKCQKANEKAYGDLLGRGQEDEEAENPYSLSDELGEAMLRDCTAERSDEALDALAKKLEDLAERAQKTKALDTSIRANDAAPAMRRLEGAVLLARVIAASARKRAESRGAHFKPAKPNRDDAAWLKTTLARWEGDAPKVVDTFDYSCAGKTLSQTTAIDTSLLKVRPRKTEGKA
ncbi:MAG: FAD-binding protein [Polyangiaceae bacterium]|nr:FAD-binding protein [Polyangiaceae bacterium]